jgi:dTDP-4-dehydrorhamnose reductase
VILLFGAGGQLGRELTERAGQAGVPLLPLTRSEADITDRSAVASAVGVKGIGMVVNAAACTNVDRAESEPDAAFAVNAGGAVIVAEACAAAGLPLVHISTDYVFDGAKPGARREDDPAGPVNNYGGSKLEGERAVRRANPRHVIVRTAWVYGVYGHNFLKTIVSLAGESSELRVVADQWGCPTSTTDLAEAVLRIWAKRDAAPWGTYHFAGQGVTTWHGFASRIVEAQARFTGKHPKVTAIMTADFPTKAKRPQSSVLDSSKFSGVFGLTAAPWEMAVDRTVGELLQGVQQ